MPYVAGRRFPYTKRGYRAARRLRRKLKRMTPFGRRRRHSRRNHMRTRFR